MSIHSTALFIAGISILTAAAALAHENPDPDIERHQQLRVRGEISGEELVLHLPTGALKGTLSLRSSSGLNLSSADVQRLAHFDGDDLHLFLSDIGVKPSDSFDDLWVRGTGPESASLLQRVAMTGSTGKNAAMEEIAPRAPGVGTTILGAPLNAPDTVKKNAGERAPAESQIEKEKRMLRSAGLEKSADDLNKQDDY